MDNKNSFKEETFGTKILVILTFTLLIGGAVAFVIAAYYFGVIGLFDLLGVKYDSLGSLFWFVIAYFALGIVGDVVIKLLRSLMTMSGRWNQRQLQIGFLMFSFFVNWAIISMLNAFMESIELETITQIIVAFLAAGLDLIFNSDRKK